MSAHVSRKPSVESLDDEPSILSSSSSSASSCMQPRSNKTHRERLDHLHPAYGYPPPNHKGRNDSNRFERGPCDNTVTQQETETQSVATQLSRARARQAQFVKDLEFENKIRRLCWTSKVPREVADKVIYAYIASEGDKWRIRTYEVQDIIERLGDLYPPPPIMDDYTPEDPRSGRPVTALTRVHPPYYQAVRSRSIDPAPALDLDGLLASNDDRHARILIKGKEYLPRSGPTVEELPDETLKDREKQPWEVSPSRG